MVESELAMSECKVNELGQQLTIAKENHADVVRQHQIEIKREREVVIRSIESTSLCVTQYCRSRNFSCVSTFSIWLWFDLYSALKQLLVVL